MWWYRAERQVLLCSRPFIQFMRCRDSGVPCVADGTLHLTDVSWFHLLRLSMSRLADLPQSNAFAFVNILSVRVWARGLKCRVHTISLTSLTRCPRVVLYIFVWETPFSSGGTQSLILFVVRVSFPFTRLNLVVFFNAHSRVSKVSKSGFLPSPVLWVKHCSWTVIAQVWMHPVIPLILFFLFWNWRITLPILIPQ